MHSNWDILQLHIYNFAKKRIKSQETTWNAFSYKNKGAI